MAMTPSRFQSNDIDTATSQMEDAGSSVREIASEAAASAKEAAVGMAGQVRDLAEGQLTDLKQDAAGKIAGVADLLQDASSQLREHDGGLVSDYVDEAVDRLEVASGYLHTSGFGEMVRDLGAFVRREPALAIGAAFALGILGSRFFKSSAPSAQA